MARLQQIYRKELVPSLMERFQYENVMQAPRLVKVTLNMGVGEATRDKKVLESAEKELGLIAGQKPIITLARKSVAGFKIREGWPIGLKVTLRRERMYEFLDRFINVAAPQIRDFRGFSPRGFDGRGNYNAGVREQIIFPEIEYDKVSRINGMNITFVTTAETDEEGRALLAELGMPFAK